MRAEVVKTLEKKRSEVSCNNYSESFELAEIIKIISKDPDISSDDLTKILESRLLSADRLGSRRALQETIELLK